MGIVDLGRATSYCVRDVAGLKTQILDIKKKNACKKKKVSVQKLRGWGQHMWSEGKEKTGSDVGLMC